MAMCPYTDFRAHWLPHFLLHRIQLARAFVITRHYLAGGFKVLERLAEESRCSSAMAN
jgi:hypothetical protein